MEEAVTMAMEKTFCPTVGKQLAEETGKLRACSRSGSIDQKFWETKYLAMEKIFEGIPL